VAGCSKRKIIDVIRELEGAGLIRKRQTARGNEYEMLISCECGAPKAPDSLPRAGDSPPLVHEAHGDSAGHAPKEYSNNNIHLSYNQSTIGAGLEEILDASGIDGLYNENERDLFRAAIEQMYRADEIKVCGVSYPQKIVRQNMRRLNYEVISSAFDTLHARDLPPKSPRKYLVSVMYRALFEADSCP
jgi:hypothetical protein